MRGPATITKDPKGGAGAGTRDDYQKTGNGGAGWVPATINGASHFLPRRLGRRVQEMSVRSQRREVARCPASGAARYPSPCRKGQSDPEQRRGRFTRPSAREGSSAARVH